MNSNIRNLETSIEEAHANFISTVQQFMVHARRHFIKNLDYNSEVMSNFGDIIIHINHINFSTQKQIVHDIAQIISKESNSDRTALTQELTELYHRYETHLPKASERKKMNVEAENLMKGVLAAV
jgi:hypothetical protein